jgi:hypothetical protein
LQQLVPTTGILRNAQNTFRNRQIDQPLILLKTGDPSNWPARYLFIWILFLFS